MELIDKSAVLAEIERRQKEEVSYDENGSFASWADENHYLTLESIKNFIDTLEVKDINSVWHNIDDIPNFNTNGVSDLIIDSYYGHIYREAHYYTPEKWDTHIGFNVNRQFRWAYEKDLIEVQEGEDI